MSANDTPKPVPVPAGLLGKKIPATTIPVHDYSVDQVAADVAAMVGILPAPVKVKKAKAPAPKPVPVTTAPIGVPLLGSQATIYTVTLPPDLTAKIAKPVTGMGGWQRAMIDLQGHVTTSQTQDPETGTVITIGTLTLTPHTLDRLIQLSVKHGSGGYQAVIRHVVCLTLAQHKAAILGGK